jgi:hypothetical protein
VHPLEARAALDGAELAVEEHLDVQPGETDNATVDHCTEDVPGTIEVGDAEMEVATPAQPDDERESGSTQEQTHNLDPTVFTDLEAYHEGIKHPQQTSVWRLSHHQLRMRTSRTHTRKHFHSFM